MRWRRRTDRGREGDAGDRPDSPQADMQPDENLDHPGGDAPRSTSSPKQWTIQGSGAG
jgi:hypothetical protein